jgi:malate dehydrogenase (oxaloacetate-decarboxylating)
MIGVFFMAARIGPSVDYTFTMRLSYPNGIGMFARITQIIGKFAADLGAVDIVSSDSKNMTRDVTVRARNQEHIQEIISAVRKIKKIKVVQVSDRVFLLHLGGKIGIQNKVPITTRDTLSMAYTPGVARVSMAIAEDHAKAWQLTIKGNSVAVVSDGTAVLGLGDIGPEGAMPVMEGKAMLFKEFGNIDAWPLCLKTKDIDEIVRIVSAVAVSFGGINLEDISAPRCFEIERRLREALDIPVFHDDQHGTAVVVLAALYNALRLTGQKLPQLKIVIAGAGAAGTAIAKILLDAGTTNILVCDREGIIGKKRDGGLKDNKIWLAEHTNPHNAQGTLEEALKDANVLVGVSGPGVLTRKSLKRMARHPFIFALANPIPEIMPEEAAGKAFIMATGRSDYPNQINNVLAFPGIFRGALNVRAREINEPMKLAAAQAIAGCITPKELNPEYIIPSVFNRDVSPRVAAAVQKAAIKSGVARRVKL